jgi:hypothetical protein
MSGTISLLPPYAFMEQTRITFYLLPSLGPYKQKIHLPGERPFASLRPFSMEQGPQLNVYDVLFPWYKYKKLFKLLKIRDFKSQTDKSVSEVSFIRDWSLTGSSFCQRQMFPFASVPATFPAKCQQRNANRKWTTFRSKLFLFVFIITALYSFPNLNSSSFLLFTHLSKSFRTITGCM